MYKCKLNKLKPTLEAFIHNLKHIYEVDKHVHLIEMTYEKFVKKCSRTFIDESLVLSSVRCTSINIDRD